MNCSMSARLGVAVTLLLLTACASVPVPKYEASYENVKVLKAAGAVPMAVTGVTANAPTANNKSISIRGNSATSPVGTGFADYIKDALVQELQRAELLSPEAPVKLSASIVENDIDAASSMGTGKLAVEVVVDAAGSTRFRKVIRATQTWESSFVGAVAIPRAIQSYPKTVELLLKSLYQDSEFIAAVKSQ